MEVKETKELQSCIANASISNSGEDSVHPLSSVESVDSAARDLPLAPSTHRTSLFERDILALFKPAEYIDTASDSLVGNEISEDLELFEETEDLHPRLGPSQKIQNLLHINQRGEIHNFTAIVDKDWQPDEEDSNSLQHLKDLQFAWNQIGFDCFRVHGLPPDTTGLASLFLPQYTTEELNPNNPSLQPKEWELGFHVGLLTLSLRQPHLFNKTPVVLRYTAKKDEQGFRFFLSEELLRERLAWRQFSNLVNPGVRDGQAMDTDFEKVAADFFGGKEVLSERQYTHKPEPPVARTKCYTITYDGPRETDKIWQACKDEPQLFMFLKDCLWSTDLENRRGKKPGTPWVNRQAITLVTVGQHSQNVDLDHNISAQRIDLETLFQTLRHKKFAPDVEDASDNEPEADLDSITSIPDLNFHEEVHLEEDSLPGSLMIDPKTATQSLGTDWMNDGKDDRGTEKEHTKASKNKKKQKISKTKSKKSIKPNKDASDHNDNATEPVVADVAPTIVESKMLVLPKSFNSFNDPSSDDKSGDWSVVPNKSLTKQPRALTASTSAKSPAGGHYGTYNRSFSLQHKKLTLPVSKAVEPPFHKQIGSIATISKSNTNQHTYALPNTTFPHKTPGSRSFQPGEFPALSTQVRGPAAETPGQEVSSTLPALQSSQILPPAGNEVAEVAYQFHDSQLNHSASIVSSALPGAGLGVDTFQPSALSTPSHLPSKCEDETSDINHSEQSSTTIQGDITHSDDLKSNGSYELDNETESLGDTLECNEVSRDQVGPVDRNDLQILEANSDSNTDVAPIMSPQKARRDSLPIALQATDKAQYDSISSHHLSLGNSNSAMDQSSYLLLTEEEAAGVVTDEMIIIRCARYSGPVAIPNFYCISENEEFGTEQAASRAISAQMCTLKPPSIRSETHSARTGAALPNFYRAPEHDRQSKKVSQHNNVQQLPPPDLEDSNGGVTVPNPIILDQTSTGFSEADSRDGGAFLSKTPLALTNSADSTRDFNAIDINHEVKVGSGLQDYDNRITGFTAPGTTQYTSMTAPMTAEETYMSSSAFNLPPIHTHPVRSFDQALTIPGPGQPVFSATASSISHAASGMTQNLPLQTYTHMQPPEPYIANGSTGPQFNNQRDVSQVDVARQLAPELPGMAAMCTQCGERTTPSLAKPQVICSGCGPNLSVHYCSVACLLVDAYHHAKQCANYPASHRAAFHDLPEPYFIYIKNPIIPQLGYFESPERFRQRAYSMYCSSGPFPPVLLAWLKRPHSPVLPFPPNYDQTESFKRTGDYHLFSTHNGAGPRNNPKSDIIFTIKFHPQDPQKHMFNRVRNACYLVWDVNLIEFLYRFVKHLLLDLESFSLFKYNHCIEFVYPIFRDQFYKEFQFRESMTRMDLPYTFNAYYEFPFIAPRLEQLEFQYPILYQQNRH